MSGRPFFSLVIPTRDRPDLLRYCLKSIQNQDFNDYEVIVADNYLKSPADGVMAEFTDPRFRYVRPDHPLSMPDNWEFAVDFASGRYVSIVIDKTVLLPTALSFTFHALEKFPAEIASWRSDAFTPKDEAKGYDVGTFVSASVPQPVSYFSPRAELERRFSLVDRRGFEKEKYFLGKMCFGVFEDELIKRIRDRHGRIFFPLSPDYTSLVLGLAYARSAVDLGRSLQISFSVSVSNGRHTQVSFAATLNYLRTIDPNLSMIDAAPIEGVYASTNNFVCYDYVKMRDAVVASDNRHLLKGVELDAAYLMFQSYEDLRGVRWSDPGAKADQYEKMRVFWKRQKFTDRFRFLAIVAAKRMRECFRWLTRCVCDFAIEVLAKIFARTPKLKMWLKKIGQKPSKVFVQETDSILIAASDSDRRQSKAGSAVAQVQCKQ